MALATAPAGLAARWRAWRIRRRFAGRRDARLLVIESADTRLLADAARRLAVLGGSA